MRGFEYLTNLAVRCPLPNPLPRGEGIMALKPTIIGFSVICPLSPWERARERVKPQI